MNVEGSLVHPDWPVRQVMEHINRSGQGIAVLVDHHRRLLATVTDGDIRRAILAGIDLDLPVSHLVEHRPPSRTPGPITAPPESHLVEHRPPSRTPGPITAPPETQPAELLRLMTQYSIGHLPIVDSENRVLDMVALGELVKEYELPLTAVVMAGGSGTRLRPLTDDLPKPMLPVGDRPLLELIIEQLYQAGIRRVNLTTHYKREVIADHFGDGRGFGVEIQYVEEDQPLGTAGALALLERPDKPLLVINGDIVTRVDFRTMLDFHREHGADMTVAVRPHEFQVPYGVVETDGVTVTNITEKPMVRHFINAGIYLLNPEVCSYIPSDEPFDMPELITKLVSEGLCVVSFPIHEYWLDIGQVEDYQRAKEDAEKGVR